MIQTKAVAWSEKFLTKTCNNCGTENSLHFVQTQKMYKFGKLKMNSGLRSFGKECSNCLDLTPTSKSNDNALAKLEYYYLRPTEENIKGKSDATRNVKYPVLNEKQRQEIRSENIKEGIMSAAVGSFIGIILSVFYQPSIWMAPIFILLGIYAAFEDPEIKFRGLIEKSKGTSIKPKRKDTKRTLQ